MLPLEHGYTAVSAAADRILIHAARRGEGTDLNRRIFAPTGTTENIPIDLVSTRGWVMCKVGCLCSESARASNSELSYFADRQGKRFIQRHRRAFCPQLRRCIFGHGTQQGCAEIGKMLENQKLTLSRYAGQQKFERQLR